MIRKFSLKNSLNNTMTLTSKSFKVFLNSPQGLGYQSAVGVARFGDKAVATDEVFEFPTVSGQILFYDDENSDRYKKYNDFVTFLSYKPLELKYTLPTTTANEYTLECYATELTKTETGENDIMTCNITLQGLSFWRGSALTVTGSASSYQLTNSGHYPVGFEIAVAGSMENPYITLEQNSEMYGEAKFNDSNAFDFVYINSNDGEQNIELKQSGNIVANPLSYQDLSISNGAIYVTFVKLARGETTLTVGCDTGSATNISITFAPEFRSV